ncbi:MAG: hypothetical protein WD875_12355 [Pirellulales bacterium]
MASTSAPTLESVYLVLLSLAIFFVATTFALRLGCHVANGVGGWSGRFAPLSPVSYRVCLRIVLLPVVALSIASGVEEPLIASLAAVHVDEKAVRFAASILEWFVFAALVASGLSDLQPTRNRLVILAAVLHVCLLLAGAYGLAFLRAAFVR